MAKMASRSLISTAQKIALRTYQKAHPELQKKQLRDWFELTYQQKIALSSVSEILSSCYQKLNDPTYRSLQHKKQHTQY
jgi:hypothetical protein